MFRDLSQVRVDQGVEFEPTVGEGGMGEVYRADASSQQRSTVGLGKIGWGHSGTLDGGRVNWRSLP